MRILIATGLFPPDIGGPATYAQNLALELTGQGHDILVVKYALEKHLPSGIRHLLFFSRVFYHLFAYNWIIAFDTFSVGFPSILAAKLLRKKIIIRIGGDFLWESYVERSANLITLKHFYSLPPKLSIKEKIIFFLTKFFLKFADALVFSTSWQRDIFKASYGIDVTRIYTIENFFGEKIRSVQAQRKNFLWAVRPIKLKNGRRLYRAFGEAKKHFSEIELDDGRFPHEELLRRVSSCYAVILPSISEVSPNLILDAIRYNKPFILTRETGYFEKLQDIGLFIDPLNEKDIAEKIIFLADDRNYKLCQQKIESFNFTHSYQNIASEFLSVYNKL